MEYKDPGRYIPIIYLLYSWGSQFGVPSRVRLLKGLRGNVNHQEPEGPGNCVEFGFHPANSKP